MIPTEENPLQHLELAAYGRTARWARFLAVVGGLLSVFLVFAAIMIRRMIVKTPDLAAIDSELPGMANISVWLLPIIAVINFVPCFILYRFALAAQRAVSHRDKNALEKSFHRLYLVFLYFGIILVIVLTIYAIAFVAIGSAALMGLGEQ